MAAGILQRNPGSFALLTSLLLSLLITASPATGQVTLPLQSITPTVNLVSSRSSGPPATVTSTAGSVTFTIGGASATLSLEAPFTITGVLNSNSYDLNPPGAFSLRIANNSLNRVQARFFDTGACAVFAGSGFQNQMPTASCDLQRIQSQTTSAGQPGARIYTVVQVSSGNSNLEYDVYFAWSTAAGFSPRVNGSIEIVQTTTYDPVFGDTRAVTLIAGRPAVARVYATSVTPIPNVTAILRGTRGPNGPALSGSPLSPMIGPSPIRSSLTLPQDVDRNDFGKSFNFLLPPDWIVAGDLTLTAELQLPSPLPAGVIVDPLQTRTIQTVTFVNGAQSLEIAYISFCYQTDSNCPTAAVSTLDSVIRNLYPMDPTRIRYFRLFTPLRPWTKPISFGIFGISDSGFRAHLDKLADFSIGRRIDQLAGWLPRIPAAGDFVGESTPNRFPNYGRGRVFMGIETGAQNYDAETLAHETGHNLLLRHTNFAALCEDKDPLTLWPYNTPSSQQPGFDAVAQMFIPASRGDLMSYCSPNGISPFDVIELLKHPLLQPAGAVRTQTVRTRSAVAENVETVVISGWAMRDNSAGAIDPLYRLPSAAAPPPSEEGGSHCLRFSGPSGPLGDYCFHLGFQNSESIVPSDIEHFTRLAPLPAGATRVTLTAGTLELASLTAASGPPTLTITSPQAGDRWSGGAPSTIAWSAADPDDRPVQFTVLYSSDGAQSWLPMAIDITESQFTFDPSRIIGGSNVFFRVLATNGMHNAAAEVGPIQVSQTPTISVPPNIEFASAAPGDAQIQTITISNPGSGPLLLSSYLTSDPAFTVVSGAGPLGIGAGETATLSVRWTPANPGQQSATLTISSNDPASPEITVQLSGTAVAAAGCTIGLNSSSSAIGATGGTGTVIVSASADDCKWSASADVPWITITGGASGSGDGRVAFTVAANPEASRRTAILTAAGVTHTVVQAWSESAAGLSPGGGTGTGTACVAPPTGLVGWWAADGNANDLRGTNNGTLRGSTFAAGRSGQGFALDGNAGHVSLGDPASLRLTSAITIEAWINPRQGPTGSAASGANMASVVTKWAQKFDPTPDSDSYGLWLRNENGALTMFAAIHQAGTAEPHVQGGSIPLGAWSHVAMTFDSASGQFALYVNGQSVASASSPGAITATTRNVLIGREDSFLPRPFNGVIDEVSIYGRALAASEIRGIYSAGAEGKCKPGGSPAPSPLTFEPASVSWNESEAGTTKTVRVANTNGSAVTITRMTSSDSNFTLATTSPLSVGPGSTQNIAIRFAPAAPGQYSGAIRVETEPATAAGEFRVSGTAPATGGVQTPVITVPTVPLDFGAVPVGQNRDVTFTIGNTGAANLTVGFLTSTNPAFTVIGPFPPIVIPSGTNRTITLRFTPTAARAESGRLVIASNDPRRPSIDVTLLGSGTAGTTASTVAQVDDGTVDTTLGLTQSGTQGYFVNRITPTRYPATLRKVIVFFAGPGAPLDGPAVGAPFQVLSATTAATGSQFSGPNLTRTDAKVTSSGAFVEYDVPAVTIQSGSFLVGFTIPTTPGIFPAALDTSPPSARRSYVSSDGNTFLLLDDVPAIGPGNFMIRARIE